MGRSRWSLLCEPGALLCIGPGLGLSSRFISQETSSDTALWSRTAAPWGRKEDTACSLHGPGSRRKQDPLPKSLWAVLPAGGWSGERPVCSQHPISDLSGRHSSSPPPMVQALCQEPSAGGRGKLWVGCPCQSRGDGLLPRRMGRFLQAESGVSRALGRRSQSGPCPRGLWWL